MTTDRDAAGMAILEKTGSLIAELAAGGERTVTQIAEVVNEPVSSTYRLLASLTAIGWVDKGSRRGLFRLGVRFVRIGSLLEDQVNVRDASKPALQSLRAATGSTTFLCFIRADTAVCVERLEGRDVHSLAMRLGDSLPLFRGAAPLALFAFLPESERDALLRGFDGRRAAGDNIPSERALRREVRRIGERGYTISDEDVTPGIAAIGAPVFNHRGELAAAISVSGLRRLILDPELDVPRLTVAAAAQASRALGYQDGSHDR